MPFDWLHIYCCTSSTKYWLSIGTVFNETIGNCFSMSPHCMHDMVYYDSLLGFLR